MTTRSTTSRTIRSTISRVVGGGGASGGGSPSYDTDAQAYITAVEAEDGEALESGVKDAINAFVVGCKADGIWSAIKASCILAGARTLDGALVPLVGSAPTNVNFVGGDYSRTAGLTGNGTTKEINSNRAGNADAQDDIHRAVWVTTGRDIGASRYICADQSLDNILGNVSGFRARVNASTLDSLGTGISVPSLVAVSRGSAANYSWRGLGASGTQATASTSNTASNVFVFSGNGVNYSSSTMAFYSIGSAINLASLDARVSALIAALVAELT